MSSSKLDSSGVFDQIELEADQTHLCIPAGNVLFRTNGIEFQSPKEFPIWTEMTVDLQSPQSGEKLKCTGVIVACHGTRHAGYNISMVLMDLTPQTQNQLRLLARSQRI